jgi:hypothetical protein
MLQLSTGGDLFTYITSHARRRLCEGEAKYISLQLLKGLRYLHDRMISHRGKFYTFCMMSSFGYLSMSVGSFHGVRPCVSPIVCYKRNLTDTCKFQISRSGSVFHFIMLCQFSHLLNLLTVAVFCHPTAMYHSYSPNSARKHPPSLSGPISPGPNR